MCAPSSKHMFFDICAISSDLDVSHKTSATVLLRTKHEKLEHSVVRWHFARTRCIAAGRHHIESTQAIGIF